MEDFGSFVGPSLVTYYDMFVKPEWRTFEVLENASHKIHDAIHRHNPKRNPPELRATRQGEHRMLLTYHSERRLCFVAKGIIRGLSVKYGEDIEVRETQCMHYGAERCHFEIVRRP